MLMSEEEDDKRRSRHNRALLFLLYMSEDSVQRFRDKLTAEGRRRRDRQIPRPSLLSPDASPWNKLFSSGDDGALITVTGFDHATFGHVLELFRPFFNAFTPWTKIMMV